MNSSKNSSTDIYENQNLNNRENLYNMTNLILNRDKLASLIRKLLWTRLPLQSTFWLSTSPTLIPVY